jgi:hypothetical protein
MTTGTQEHKTTGTQEHHLSKGADIRLTTRDGTVLAGYVATTRDGQVTVAVDGPAVDQPMPHGGTDSMAALGALLIATARLPVEASWTVVSAMVVRPLTVAALIPRH